MEAITVLSRLTKIVAHQSVLATAIALDSMTKLAIFYASPLTKTLNTESRIDLEDV